LGLTRKEIAEGKKVGKKFQKEKGEPTAITKKSEAGGPVPGDGGGKNEGGGGERAPKKRNATWGPPFLERKKKGRPGERKKKGPEKKNPGGKLGGKKRPTPRDH